MVCLIAAALALAAIGVAQAPATPADAGALAHELGTFPASIPAAPPSDLRISPLEQRRDVVYRELRVLDKAAVTALSTGLGDPDVRVRRGVALYLEWAGGNYARVAPEPLDLRPYLVPLTAALRDRDQRVQELSAQAVGLIGPAAVVAVPDLIRMLEEPAEGLRNTACIALAGIGPPARDALPALHAALADPSKDVRQFARHAIDKIEGRPPAA